MGKLVLNPEFKTEVVFFDERVPLQIELLAYRTLALAIQKAINAEEKSFFAEECYDMINKVSSYFPHDGGLVSDLFSTMECAALQFVTDVWNQSQYERAMYGKILPLIKETFIDAKEVYPELKKGHHPDMFIESGGRVIPVEVKRGKFDNKAISQLRRYMDVYESEVGIGVARQIPEHECEGMIFLKTT